VKLIDVIAQLHLAVPRITNLFTEELTVASLTSSGTTATLVTTTEHNLVTGQCINISGALTPNTITTLTQTDNIASAETAANHDLTEGFIGAPIDEVFIEGANEADYNGTHELLTVPNRRNFTYQIANDPASPATGSPILLENLKYGYNGLHIVTVVDATTVTYTLPKAQGSPAGGDIVCRVSPRITGSITPDRAIDAYTRQQSNKMWAFVTLGNRFASKDRAEDNDTTAAPGKGMDYRQLVIQPVAVYVFIPSSDDIGGRAARDQAEEILPILCSSLLRVRLPTGFSESAYSGLVFSSDNFYAYNGAFYVHEYIFESTSYIAYADTYVPDFGVAFREITSDIISSISNEIIMTDGVNLDDDPIST
jgi:hypothetical protein